jgi:probable HAF family extracellular repeat protein
MTNHRRALVLAAAVLVAGCGDGAQPTTPSESPALVPGNRPGATGVTITDLGILPNRLSNKSSLAWGLNTTVIRENVAVVGQSTVNCCNAHGFLWTAAGGISDLGTLLPNGAGSSFAFGVSDNGTIVGTSDVAGTSFFGSGFVRPSGGAMTALSLLASGVGGAAQDISGNSSYIVGSNVVPVPGGAANEVAAHAVIWDGPSWTIDSIGPGHALAVSDGRTVVGGTEGAVNRAVVWTESGGSWSALQLQALPSEAWDINPVGDRIAGERQDGGGLLAVVWVKAAGTGTWTPTDLASLGGTVSQALGVSNAGWVVGMSQTARGTFRAALWKPNPDGGYNLPEDLGAFTKGGTSRAFAINENRQIAGGGKVKGSEHGALWTLPLE